MWCRWRRSSPDGLVVTSAGDYVRSLALERVLQPLAGGPAHRDALRDRLGALGAALPPGQSVQVIVEDEPLDAARALARDWREITSAAGGADGAGDALRRLGYGLEQSVRASAPIVDAAEL